MCVCVCVCVYVCMYLRSRFIYLPLSYMNAIHGGFCTIASSLLTYYSFVSAISFVYRLCVFFHATILSLCYCCNYHLLSVCTTFVSIETVNNVQYNKV